LTVFPQRTGKRDDFRIWSAQYFRYAGYKIDDQTILGDPANVEFTELCMELGWEPPKERTQFDVLPIVVHAPNEPPRWFDVSDLLLEVQITHPNYPWFDELGLKWYVLPAVSGMMFDVGGIQFTAAPFNGWYMAPEIAARNFGDTYRYNLLETVADHMGLETSTFSSLWKDRALVELNFAVLHSFKEAQVTISDHHSAAESFMQHLEREMSLRGGCPSDWVWIVPPLSGSATPVFHQEMLNYKLKPSFEYQEPAWLAKRLSDKDDNQTGTARRGSKLTLASAARVVMMSMSMFSPHLMKRVKATVLYATETGKSERYAKDVANLFSHAFAVKVNCMEDFVFSDIEYEELLLVVTSTFGNGDPPDNGESFGRQLYQMRHPPDETRGRRKVSSGIHLGLSSTDTDNKDDSQPLANVRFSVFGLGSRAYPNFCAFARSVDKLLGELGGEQIYEIGQGDELCGQEESFRKWVTSCYEAACKTFCVDANLKDFSDALATSSREWQPDKFRIEIQNKQTVKELDVCKSLSDLHKKTVFPCKLITRSNLQSEESQRSTILVQLDTQGEPQLVHEPGDHLAIFPQNQPSLVNQLIKKLDGSPPADEPLTVEYKVPGKGKEVISFGAKLDKC
jgi:nitric oxide synthase oxygenase domain/subunit/flavodoxin